MFLVPTLQLTTVCNSSSREFYALSGILRHKAHTPVVHEDKYSYPQNIYTPFKKILNEELKV